MPELSKIRKNVIILSVVGGIMDNYRIIDMSNDKYDAAGIRLPSGKNCIYFKNKGCNFNSVIIGRDYNVNIAGNEIALVFKKEDSVEDIVELTKVFIKEFNLDVNNTSFICYVSNEVEDNEMQDVASLLGIEFVVKRSEKYRQFLFNKELIERKKREEEEREKFVSEAEETKKDDNLIEKESDEFFNETSNTTEEDDDIPFVVEKKKTISEIVSEDWEQTKEEELFWQKDIEPKIYEKPSKKKNKKVKNPKKGKSKLVIILVVISVLLLICAALLYFFGILKFHF